jgi:hypothetical protein
MSLLGEIRDGAVNAKSDIGELLRKCMVLAYRLDNGDFKKWVEYELNGYLQGSVVPDYRKFNVNSYGNFVGFGWSKLNNQPIPLSQVDEKHKDFLSKHLFVDSASALSFLIEGKSGGERLSVSWPPDLIAYYSGRIMEDWQCYRVWKQIAAYSITSILDNIRSRVLAFVLELEKEVPDIGEELNARFDSERVQQNFNTIIMGDVTNLATGGAQTVTFNTDITINQNDFDSLKNYLLANGVLHEDIELLKSAIEEDPPVEKQGDLGNKVKAWISDMVEKAKNGAIQIAPTIATNLLTQALFKYYLG